MTNKVAVIFLICIVCSFSCGKNDDPTSQGEELVDYIEIHDIKSDKKHVITENIVGISVIDDDFIYWMVAQVDTDVTPIPACEEIEILVEDHIEIDQFLFEFEYEETPDEIEIQDLYIAESLYSDNEEPAGRVDIYSDVIEIQTNIDNIVWNTNVKGRIEGSFTIKEQQANSDAKDVLNVKFNLPACEWIEE